MPTVKVGAGEREENLGIEFYVSGTISEVNPYYANLEIGGRVSNTFGKETNFIRPYIGIQVSYDIAKDLGSGASGGLFVGLNLSISKSYSIFLEGGTNYLLLSSNKINGPTPTTDSGLVLALAESPKTNIWGATGTIGLEYKF